MLLTPITGTFGAELSGERVADGIDGVLLFVCQVHAHLSSTVHRSFGWVDNR